MQLITTTQLRTRSRELVKTLKYGQSVDLVHRSEIIGEIKPKLTGKVFSAKRMAKIAEKLNLPILTDEEKDQRYREAMEIKHGKSIS